MNPSPDYLLISQAAAAAFAAARLLHFGLRRKFPRLLAFLVLTAFVSTAISILNPVARPYYYTYMFCQPLSLCVEAAAVYEMYSLIFQDYPGIRTAGRWAVYLALFVSTGVSLALTRVIFTAQQTKTSYLLYELNLDRSIVFGLALVILVLLLFLSRYPLDLDRNTYVVSGFFSAMFLSNALVKLIDSLQPHLFFRYADLGDVAFSTVCFVGWGGMLRVASALKPAASAPNTVREAELLAQLDALNSILSRSTTR